MTKYTNDQIKRSSLILSPEEHNTTWLCNLDQPFTNLPEKLI